MSDNDDEELGALFRAAASDPGAPAPRFDHDSVVSASRRATVRRRVAVAGSAVVLLAVAGVGAAVTLPGSLRGDDTTVAAPMLAPAPAAAPGARQDAAPGADARAEGAAPPLGPVGRPLGPGTTECADRQDPALRTLVEEVLPAVRDASEAATTMECRPRGERGVNVEIDDGGATGLLAVQYLPPGTIVALVPGAVSAPTASGGTVIVSSRPAEVGAPAPFEDRLTSVADFLAPRL
ncbi:hypothetical protein ACQPZA_01855 [Pseudonocardia xinjiangensis]|uniref:hypothetical protein n=1 Tax=Pseudonocardia xinjiangensis TaxID=75289 RepID=UPI003D94687E